VEVVKETMPSMPPPEEQDRLKVYRERTHAIAQTGSYVLVGRPVKPFWAPTLAASSKHVTMVKQADFKLRLGKSFITTAMVEKRAQ
jgi:hypothetical protein